MTYCQECATEYAELLPWCPNCGTENPADDDEWEEDVMTDDELVVVFNAEDEVQALLYRNLLEEAGIPVIERPLEAEWLEGVMHQDLHSQLLVREDDAEEAHRLVEAFRREAEEGILSAEIPENNTAESGDNQSASNG
jgi:hypothetical protein